MSYKVCVTKEDLLADAKDALDRAERQIAKTREAMANGDWVEAVNRSDGARLAGDSASHRLMEVMNGQYAVPAPEPGFTKAEDAGAGKLRPSDD